MLSYGTGNRAERGVMNGGMYMVGVWRDVSIAGGNLP